ncbi:hypothetical protein Tco_0443098 [Tanacetum coccineum]
MGLRPREVVSEQDELPSSVGLDFKRSIYGGRCPPDILRQCDALTALGETPAIGRSNFCCQRGRGSHVSFAVLPGERIEQGIRIQESRTKLNCDQNLTIPRQRRQKLVAVVVRDFYKKFYNSLGSVPNLCSAV